MGRETCFIPPHANMSGSIEDCALGYSGLDDKKLCEAKGHLWQTTYANWNWMKVCICMYVYVYMYVYVCM